MKTNAGPFGAIARLAPRRVASLVALAVIGCAFARLFATDPPTGSVAGHVVLGDSGASLSDVRVTLYPQSEKDDDSGPVRRAVTQPDGSFRLSHVRAGLYNLSAGARYHGAHQILVGVYDGETTPILVSLKRSQSDLAMKSHQQVFGTGEPAHFSVSGYVDSALAQRDRLRIRVWRTRLSSVLSNRDGAEALESMTRSYDRADTVPKKLIHPTVGPAPEPVQDRRAPIHDEDREGFFYQQVELGALASGLYVVDVSHGDKSVCTWLLATDTALVVKRANRQLVAYVTNMQSGLSAGPCPVRVYRGGRVVASARSDGRGVAEIHLPHGGNSDAEEDVDARSGDELMTVASRGSDEAVVTGNGGVNEDEGNLRIHAYTDRPIYRPGQRIYFKGIARRVMTLTERSGVEALDAPPGEPGPRYIVPAHESVRVEIRAPSGEQVLRTRLVTNGYGSFAGYADLSPEASTGVYTLVMNMGGSEHSHDIVVAAYQKPEFSVTVTPEKKQYVRGETVAMTVSAQFYFGAPLAGTKVTYYVNHSPDWAGEYEDEYPGEDAEASPNEEDPYLYRDQGEPYYGESLTDGSVVLDANGKAVVRFKPGAASSGTGSQAEVYTLSASVAEREDRTVEADGQVVVTEGDYRLYVEPEGYVAAPGRPESVTVKAVDNSGRPVPGVAVELETGYETCASRSPRDKSPERTFKRAAVQRVLLGADGRAQAVIVPPRAGEMVLKVRGQDPARRTIQNATYLWVSDDSGGDLDTEYADLSLLPDRRGYRPGDTARVLLNAGHVGQDCLVTIEGDRVYRAQTVRLRRKSTLLHVPIPPEYGPNVYLAVCYIQDRHFAQCEIPLRVATPLRALKVTIQADKEPGAGGGLARYHPGDHIKYTVRTTDADGRPRPAEFSFGVVDEAIYALREDDARALYNAFYPRRRNSVNTDYSFAVTYLGDADKAEPQITARKRFPDTAFWAPVLQTDARGMATVTFTLPDNLTSWRATINAHTLDTRLGRAQDRVIVFKEFLVRAETPRFLTQGDRSQIVGIVHNDTGAAQTALLHLKADNLTVSGETVQTVHVAPGATAEVDWPVRADGYGTAGIRITAWTPRSSTGSQFTDGVQVSLPIRPHGRESIVSYAGEVTAAHPETEVVRVDPNALPELSRLTVRATPTVASALTGATDYLIGFPYGCTEQTMSRFLPDLLVDRALRQNGLPPPKKAALLPLMVRDGLARLARFQHEESGGWGWWEHDDDDAWMTAYVIYGLATARAEGYPVSATVMAKGSKAAATLLKRANLDPTDRAFLTYAVALTGSREAALRELPRIRPRTPARRLAYSPRGLIPAQLGASSEGGSAAQLLAPEAIAFRLLSRRQLGLPTNADAAELQRQSIGQNGLCHWKAPSSSWVEDDRQTTAIVLRAVLAADPNSPCIAGALRWLMAHRTGEYWESTRTTSFVLAALCDYLAMHRAVRQGGQVRVLLNGAAVKTYTLTPEVLRETELILRIPASAMRPGKNDVTLERMGGDSSVFYSVELRQTVASNDLPAVTPPSLTGLGLRREILRILPSESGQSPWGVHTEGANGRVRQGEHLRVRITLTVPQEMDYVLIEDAFPAGCEVTERGDAGEITDWRSWWSSTDVRDDRIAFFARTLHKGTEVIEYNLQARTPGSYRVLPCLLQAMYAPEMHAETAEEWLEVTP